jgi:predicted nucleic acid-binding protein
MSVGVAVVDAWALLAFLRGEGQAGRSMRRYLRRARSGNLQLLLNLINMGEVYYRIAQLRGQDEALEALALIRALPLDIFPVRERLVLEAARLKLEYPLSYADAFAVATARLANGPVITGDPEILGLPRGVVAVRQLGRRDR